MPGTLEQNCVADRRNITLIDMMRNMISICSLSKFLLGETLKTTIYILNRVPNKSTLEMLGVAIGCARGEFFLINGRVRSTRLETGQGTINLNPTHL